jgi:lysophospholipase L1-like esterase
MINVNSIPKRVVFHGNSLFHLRQGNVLNGFAVSTLVRPQLTGVVVQDYSYQGKTSAQLLAEFPTVVQPYVNKGDVIVFWDGRNSMANNIGNLSPANALIDAKAYCANAISLGLKVITLTCIPTSTTYVADADRLTFNTNMLADTSFCNAVVDPCALTEFNSVADLSNATYYNADQIHLTTAGYTLIANLLAPTIQSVANS